MARSSFWCCLLLTSSVISTNSPSRDGSEASPGAGGSVAEVLIELGNLSFALDEDALHAPGFEVLRRREDPQWARRPPHPLTQDDCGALESIRRPTVLNTHKVLYTSGYMTGLPYLLREHCEQGVASMMDEVAFVARRRSVWVSRHGAMMYKGGVGPKQEGIQERWRVLIQHPEYHNLNAREVEEVNCVDYADLLVNVGQVHSHNFYHFIAEVLPRLLLVPSSVFVRNGTRILLPPFSKNRKSFVESFLELLDINKDQVVSSHYQGCLLYAREVWYSSFSPFRWHSQTPRNALLSVHVAVLQRMPCRSRTADTPSLLIARREAEEERGGARSDLENWDQVLLWMEERKERRKISLTKIFPGRESLEEQVESCDGSSLFDAQQVCSFSSAEALLGSHGSNLANMLWMRRGSIVFEIHKPASERGPVFGNFWHMAEALELRSVRWEEGGRRRERGDKRSVEGLSTSTSTSTRMRREGGGKVTTKQDGRDQV
eukprot:747091-Hanusia_phi.AAC.3